MIKRNISFDRFRGIIVFLMIFFQLLEHFSVFGVLGQLAVHASDAFALRATKIAIYFLPNLTLADLIAPAFMFAIALNFIPAFNRRVEKYGKEKAAIKYYERYLKLVGIGMLLESVNIIIDGEFDYIHTYILVGCLGIFLLLGLAWCITKLIKKDVPIIGKLIKYDVLFVGFFGIVLTTVNFILLATGTFEENFGNWVTLQHIGLAGIIATFVMSMFKDNSTKNRFIAGLVILLIFSIFHEGTLPTLKNNLFITNNMKIIDNTADGSFMGAFAYSGLLLIFTAFSDIYYKDKKKFMKYSLLTLIPTVIVILIACSTFTPWVEGSGLLSGGLSKFLSINKGSISPSFIVISLSTSLIMFILVDFFVNATREMSLISIAASLVFMVLFYYLKLIALVFFLGILAFYILIHLLSKLIGFDLFSCIGKNAILMFILEFALIGGFAAFVDLSSATLPVAIIEVIVLMGILIFISYRLEKKNKVVKIG